MLAIRPATAANAAVIAGQRRAMFHDMGHRDDSALDNMTTAFLPWVRDRLASGEYLSWLAIDAGGAPAAGAGLWLMDWPPHMLGPGSRRGNILNVYTRPDVRRQGLARQLTEIALAWCRGNSIGVVILHASEEGSSLYRALGFQPSNEMRLPLGK
jgi:GNAT superfamily N-acetyltransferase